MTIMAPVSRGLSLYGRTGSINAVARDRVMSIFLFLSIDESRCKIELQMGLIRDQGQKQRFSSCERARHGTRDRRLHVRALRWLVTGILVSLTATAETSVRAPSLDDFFSEPELVSAAISPSGRQVAMVHRREDADRILVLDVDSGQSRAIVQFDRKALGEGTEAHIRAVYWKSDERLLFRTGGTVESANATFSRRTYSRLGSRIFAVDRDGHNMVRLLADVDRNATRGTLDFGRIESLLPRDPNHVMMSVFGYTGGGLLKVDLRTGQGEMVEGPERDVDDWWLDLDGNPIVKVESSRGAVRYYSKQPDGQWKKFHSIRYDELDQLPEYTAVGPSTQPQKYFVIARPEGTRPQGAVPVRPTCWVLQRTRGRESTLRPGLGGDRPRRHPCRADMPHREHRGVRIRGPCDQQPPAGHPQALHRHRKRLRDRHVAGPAGHPARGRRSVTGAGHLSLRSGTQERHAARTRAAGS